MFMEVVTHKDRNRHLTQHAVDGGCHGLPVICRLVVVLCVGPLQSGGELYNLHPSSGKLKIIAQLEIDMVEMHENHHRKFDFMTNHKYMYPKIDST